MRTNTLPGERATFELYKPFTTEELVGLADSLRGRRRAAVLAYANTLKREDSIAKLQTKCDRMESALQSILKDTANPILTLEQLQDNASCDARNALTEPKK